MPGIYPWSFGIDLSPYLTIASAASTYFPLAGGTLTGSIKFGGATSSFPMLQRSASALYVRLADDSGYADLWVNRLYVDGVKAATHQSALNNWYFGNAGNATGTGATNTAVGASALSLNTTGASSTAVGYNALKVNTTGASSTAVGVSALAGNTSGASNTAVGYDALRANTTGGSSVAVGVNALRWSATGSGLVGIGFSAGRYELGGDAFYVNNVDQSTTAGDKAYSLLYGTFSGTAGSLIGQKLVINGDLSFTLDLYCGATKVLGAQGAAVADATDAASAITQLNALLARVRAHGLIAT